MNNHIMIYGGSVHMIDRLREITVGSMANLWLQRYFRGIQVCIYVQCMTFNFCKGILEWN